MNDHRLVSALRFVLVTCVLLALPLAAEEERELNWIDLIPPEERDRQLSEPLIDHSLYGAPVQSMVGGIVPELNGKSVRIPGFIVPVEMTEDYRLREFFLVPYFGACIHMPPPPPNQIVYGVLGEAEAFDSIYEPVWVHGTMRTDSVSNSIASAFYRMTVDRIEPYDWE